MSFRRYSVFNHLGEGLDACSEGNAENTGPSREWRFEGVPTTTEVLIALLQAKYISAVDVGVVFRPLQKNITGQCIEFMAMFFSTSVRKSNVQLSNKRKDRIIVPVGDDIAASLEEK